MQRFIECADVGACCQDSVVSGNDFRFTVLTSYLIRMEYSPNRVFVDLPTQIVQNRYFECPHFTVIQSDSDLVIETEYLSLFYDRKPFSPNGLSIKVRTETNGIYSTWHFGEKSEDNLWGTARTLDQVNGSTALEPGLLSRFCGYGTINDSESLLISLDGKLLVRDNKAQDWYFFGYGLQYEQCIKDYFHLCGSVPMLPRFAFGNWWSRFHAYSEDDYLSLMNQFEEEKFPLSVAVLDMDWHITEVKPEDGKGWTGYNWNTKLFPEPEIFLKKLHQKELKVALNLHPAEGVQPHEEQFAKFAEAMNMDKSKRHAIPFDFTDRKFIYNYFRLLIHPLEKQGVDFWWIDWQQGNLSKIPGADPLWLLNYYHTKDCELKGKRSIVLSRYAGAGSHRFPIGFSGDTVISWDSLDFQPYFTATASNIGYSWWSHDIGGHASGDKDNERMVRWVQFGVFSPILRLHSTSNLFGGKEPWNFDEPERSVINKFLRLRHQLIPYLYTMNWRCHKYGEMLIKPMYYEWPNEKAAYEIKNEYTFGTELIVCPITTPMNKKLQFGRSAGWLPQGEYYDFFTGRHYRGGRKFTFYRTINEIPVFAKSGAIIPITCVEEAESNGVKNPQQVEVRVFPGQSGRFNLYEDDGETLEEQREEYITQFSFYRDDRKGMFFRIEMSMLNFNYISENRKYTIVFLGVKNNSHYFVQFDGQKLDKECSTCEYENNMLRVHLPVIKDTRVIELFFPEGLDLAENNVESEVYERLKKMQVSLALKDEIYHSMKKTLDKGMLICEWQNMHMPQEIIEALTEVLMAE